MTPNPRTPQGSALVCAPQSCGARLAARGRPAAPDDAPQRLAHVSAIEACHSVAGDENYILKVRVASPTALEDLLYQIRTLGGVSTRTTVVLSTPYENRPPNF